MARGKTGRKSGKRKGEELRECMQEVCDAGLSCADGSEVFSEIARKAHALAAHQEYMGLDTSECALVVQLGAWDTKCMTALVSLRDWYGHDAAQMVVDRIMSCPGLRREFNAFARMSKVAENSACIYRYPRTFIVGPLKKAMMRFRLELSCDEDDEVGECGVCMEKHESLKALFECGMHFFCEGCCSKMKTCPTCRAPAKEMVCVSEQKLEQCARVVKAAMEETPSESPPKFQVYGEPIC